MIDKHPNATTRRFGIAIGVVTERFDILATRRLEPVQGFLA